VENIVTPMTPQNVMNYCSLSVEGPADCIDGLTAICQCGRQRL
jgi:hypothetical protein